MVRRGSGRADGEASRLRLCLAASAFLKERPFFLSFGDEERLSFFQKPKGFGFSRRLAGLWPAGRRRRAVRRRGS